MSELVNALRSEFQDKEYRHSYAEECVNTMIASQIKVLREERGMTQLALASSAEMAQPRLSVMEHADYSNWSINTLKRLAKAFDLALSVKFEAFSDVVMDFEEMSKETLSRPSFKEDPIFRSEKVRTHRAFRRRQRYADSDKPMADALQMRLRFLAPVTEIAKASRNNSAYSLDQKGTESNATSVSAAS